MAAVEHDAAPATSPERTLVLAILERALLDACALALGALGPVARARTRDEARVWLASAEPGVGGARWCCDVLGIDQRALRDRIAAQGWTWNETGQYHAAHRSVGDVAPISAPRVRRRRGAPMSEGAVVARTCQRAGCGRDFSYVVTEGKRAPRLCPTCKDGDGAVVPAIAKRAASERKVTRRKRPVKVPRRVKEARTNGFAPTLGNAMGDMIDQLLQLRAAYAAHIERLDRAVEHLRALA